MIVRKKPVENSAGKGKNAGNDHFLPFPQCFSYLSKKNFHHLSHFGILECKYFQCGQNLEFVVWDCKIPRFC